MTDTCVPDSASGPSPPIAELTGAGICHRYMFSLHYDVCDMIFETHQHSFAELYNIVRHSIPFGHFTDIGQKRTADKNNLSFTEKLRQSFFGNAVTLEGSSGNYQLCKPVTPPDNTDPDDYGYYFHKTFEGNIFSWRGSGTAKATLSGRTPYRTRKHLLRKHGETAHDLVPALQYADTA